MRQAALKWPNDLLVDGAKLGGILVEARTPGGSRNQGSYAVIGLGINCRRTRGLAAKLGREVAFVGDFIAVSRNQILQATASALLAALDAFEAGGLRRCAPNGKRWTRMPGSGCACAWPTAA